MERYLVLDETPMKPFVCFDSSDTDSVSTAAVSDEQTYPTLDNVKLHNTTYAPVNSTNPFKLYNTNHSTPSYNLNLTTHLPLNQNLQQPVPKILRSQSPILPYEGIKNETLMEKTLLNITSAFTDTLKNLNNHYAKPNRKPSTVFFGFEYDNPISFIETLEIYFLESGIEDSERVSLASSLLKGKAKEWFEPYNSINISWLCFREQFLNQFNNISVLALATSVLYGEPQNQLESVTVFIAKKIALFARLDPAKSNQMKAAIIIELLRPEIRSRIRRYGIPMTCEELMTLAAAVEKDFAGELKILKQQFTPVFDEPLPKPNRQQYNAMPPSPCKFCQQWHYQKDCPKNPYNSVNREMAGRGPSSHSRLANNFAKKQ